MMSSVKEPLAGLALLVIFGFLIWYNRPIENPPLVDPYSQGQTPFFGKMPLSKISIFDIERYKKQRLEEDVQQNITKDGTPIYKGKTSPGTINRELAALSHLFTKAVEWGWLDHKPASIKRLKENGGRITYLTVDQIKRLLKAGQEDQNIQIYPLF